MESNTALPTREATELVGECYTTLSKYVTKTRAYASVVDGLKTVYRRIIYASARYNQRVKSAAIVGDSIKYHPHGDASIYDSLVQMACEFGRFPLYNKKGNFGGQGQGYAAMRYTEACLSDVARLMYLELIDYAEMIDGEAGYPEPKYLPALLPYCLLVGTTSIPVGMPTPNIPPLNVLELVDYYIGILKHEKPQYPTPDLGEVFLDCNRDEVINPFLKSGQGRLWFRGIITQEDTNKFVVTSETPNCSFWKLRSKVESWIDQDILDYSDETDGNGDRHVFTITNMSKLSPDQLKSTLERALKCSVSYNFILEEDERAVYCGLDYIVSKSLRYLRECAIRKFTDYSNKAQGKLVILQAIRDFKNSGYASTMHNESDSDIINHVIDLGYEEWVGKAMLDKPMKYLTRSHDEEIKALEQELNSYQEYIDDPDSYLLTLYYRLRQMIIPIYNQRGHSIVLDELGSIKPKYATIIQDQQVIHISEDNSGVSWNRLLYLVADDGTVISKYVASRINADIDVSTDGHNYSAIGSDKGKYLVVLLGDSFIFVKELDGLNGSKQRFKTWDGLHITKVLTSKSGAAQVTDIRGNTFSVRLSDYIKSRVSNPIKYSKYPVKEFVLDESD